jgi:hypothetical protein
MYVYGIIIGLGIPINEILQNYLTPPLESLITFGISGVILLIIGLATLKKFTKKYPIPKMETINEK